MPSRALAGESVGATGAADEVLVVERGRGGEGGGGGARRARGRGGGIGRELGIWPGTRGTKGMSVVGWASLAASAAALRSAMSEAWISSSCRWMRARAAEHPCCDPEVVEVTLYELGDAEVGAAAAVADRVWVADIGGGRREEEARPPLGFVSVPPTPSRRPHLPPSTRVMHSPSSPPLSSPSKNSPLLSERAPRRRGVAARCASLRSHSQIYPRMHRDRRRALVSCVIAPSALAFAP